MHVLAQTASPPPAAPRSVWSGLIQFWNDLIGHLPYLALGAIVLLVTWLVVAIVRAVLQRVLARVDLRSSLADLLLTVAVAACWTTGLVAAGIVVFPSLTPGRLLATLGLGSIAIGFAFKDIFENFFAGVMILWRYPFDRGDVIQVGDVVAEVEEIWIRMTLLRQPDGKQVLMPNGELFRKPVAVLTSRGSRRIEGEVGVAYGTDLDVARKVLTRAIEGCSSVDADRPVEVHAARFGASSVDFSLLWWAKPTPIEQRRSRDEVLRAVHRELHDNDIEIPFPQRVLSFADDGALTTLVGNGPEETS